ncbi:MAG TPA: Na+/H+ antiporter subunit G [Pseudogracilibacillus sp.]|nr:Na+/H+ antiporter subunit G [Pseudogracilibacillus sp.]
MNENVTFELIGAILILIGSIISMISAVGIIRFRDVYSRAHAATKTTTLAVLLTLTGVFIYFWLGEGYISVRLSLVIVFVFITAPVSGHLVLRAAYRSHVKMSDATAEDELREVVFKTEQKHK